MFLKSFEFYLFFKKILFLRAPGWLSQLIGGQMITLGYISCHSPPSGLNKLYSFHMKNILTTSQIIRQWERHKTISIDTSKEEKNKKA